MFVNNNPQIFSKLLSQLRENETYAGFKLKMKETLSKCKHIYIIVIFSLFHVSRNFFHFFQQVILFVQQLAHLIQHRNDSFKTFSTTNISIYLIFMCVKIIV